MAILHHLVSPLTHFAVPKAIKMDDLQIRIVKSSQVTFIYIALFTIQIVSKQLHSDNM